MKKIYFAILVFIFAFVASYAQAYRKGSLLISISEGSTWANYTTINMNPENPPVKKRRCIDGVRDPLIIDYALTDRWSIGLTSGADIFKVKSSEFYGFGDADKTLKITTGEFTFDCSYHVFVNKRLDLSVSTSTGIFATTFNETDGETTYKYSANGTIHRFGTRVRYYFWKRLGAFGMASTYFANSSPKDVKDNTVGKNYDTKIDGFAIEGGLCFRFF